MPRFDIVREITADKSFKVEQVKSGFDLQTDHVSEHFVGDIAIEGRDWNVGVIVGRSGTGKTTIAREVFADYYPEPYIYGDAAIVDEMPPGKTYKEITAAFTSVGFSSPPSWLKPYAVLSTGEKMRVDLAREILSDKEIAVFDEFTSVVDREVAKVCAYAISKAVRRLNKKFIAVSCHEDIVDWLEPDWVYDTNLQTFTFRGHQRTRPEIKIDVYRTEGRKDTLWKIFGKYHYLSPVLNNGTHQYVGYIDGRPVCHCGILQVPIRPGVRRIHRLVVLPDYQGVGIGTRFISHLADLYQRDGVEIHIITSHPGLLHGLMKLKTWVLFRAGRAGSAASLAKTVVHGGEISLMKNASSRRVTYSLKYIGEVADGQD